MKLRNKKTGEVIDSLQRSELILDYGSLAELNAEWEDYEEPKEYWYISWCGNVANDKYTGIVTDEKCKEIGNYFETEEEAEKAVEKLKAWKRLKDKGFKFTGWEESPSEDDFDTIFFITENRALDQETLDALELLFGGEE